MGYTALLFCPDDKTARTLTQVLSELEFTVEACIEPFAAVKKLMGIHFDAVVVDCDNEQNATLLFKSARNSTSNQTSLAVAVVEGQAGVAKAFRIGANLVLTKPINIEQAKGTLRVARGLLRKSEPAKPGTPGTTTAAMPAVPAGPTPPAAAKPAAPKPAPAAAKPAVPVAPKPAAPPAAQSSLPPRPVQGPSVKAVTPAIPAAAGSAQDDDLLEIDTHETKPVGGTALSAPSVVAPNPILPAPTVERKPEFASTTRSTIGSGAASAPAPAREHQDTKVAESHLATPEKSVAEAAPSEPSTYVGSAPSFTFGASSSAESSGGNKKIFIGVAAAIVLVIAGYVGLSMLKGHSSQAPAPTTQPSAGSAPQLTKPGSAQPAPAPVTTAVAPSAAAPSETSTAAEVPAATPADNEKDSASEEATSPAAAKPAKPSKPSASMQSKPTAAASTKEVASEAEPEPEPAPMVVKGGKAPKAHSDSAAADAPSAPSIAGMAAGAAAPPPDLGTASPDDLKPMLQTLNISQGVSQGLLFKKVAPTYPQNALRMRIEGPVELQATIAKTGDISHVKVLSGDPQLAKAASDAVKQWKYKPYLLNGEPVEIQTQITVNFKLPH